MADAAALTLLGVVVGWGATHIFSEARERRKEYRAQLEKVHELTSRIEQSARAFHRSEKHDPMKASDLVSQLAWLERSILRIPIFESNGWTPALVAFRQAITLRNFDASVFVQQSDVSEIVADISDAAFDLEDMRTAFVACADAGTITVTTVHENTTLSEFAERRAQ